MLTLSISERLALKGRAHAINPTVMIGNAGLTESVLREIAQTLKVHELIKVRVLAEREQREAYMITICEQLNAAPIQHIGKVLVIYQPNPETAKNTETKSAANNKPQRPKAKRLTKRQLGER